MIDKQVKKYNLRDPKQYDDEIVFWSKVPFEKKA